MSGKAPEGTGVTWGLRPIEGGPSDLPLLAGDAQELYPGILRVLAPNPGLMTGPGTNTYVVGGDSVAVIDPGPTDDAHLEAIDEAIGGRTVAAVVVTHHHVDHAPAARPVAEAHKAPFLAFPGKLEPDVELAEGDQIPGMPAELLALHTPGHASDHVCLLLSDSGIMFSGDHVMGGSTVVIAPPDGDMAAYLESIDRLRAMGLKTILPGHGQPVTDPNPLLDWYLAHRKEREAQVSAALRPEALSIDELVALIYEDVPKAAYPVAAYSVWAHLEKLSDEGSARKVSGEGTSSEWSSVDDPES